jgi:hypothetical protein
MKVRALKQWTHSSPLIKSFPAAAAAADYFQRRLTSFADFARRVAQRARIL